MKKMLRSDEVFEKRNEIINYLYKDLSSCLVEQKLDIIIGEMEIKLSVHKMKHPTADIRDSQETIDELREIQKSFKILYFNTFQAKEGYIKIQKDYSELMTEALFLKEENKKMRGMLTL